MNWPLGVQPITESVHSSDEICAAVEFAGDEVRAIVLHGDEVCAGGNGRAIDEDVIGKTLERAEDFVKRLFEIMERA